MADNTKKTGFLCESCQSQTDNLDALQVINDIFSDLFGVLEDFREEMSEQTKLLKNISRCVDKSKEPNHEHP